MRNLVFCFAVLGLAFLTTTVVAGVGPAVLALVGGLAGGAIVGIISNL